MTDEQFLREVKRYVHDIEPKAEVWLFGSQARKDAHKDSDWDFLVLTDEVVNRTFKRRMRDNLFYLELDSERVIGTVIQNKVDWKNWEMLELHFIKTSLLPVEWGRFYAQLFNERNDSD